MATAKTLEELLLAEMGRLVESRNALNDRIKAIDLLLGGAIDDQEDAQQAEVAPPPKAKRGRRTNAQIAADKAAAGGKS